jgi:hypothetical protein
MYIYRTIHDARFRKWKREPSPRVWTTSVEPQGARTQQAVVGVCVFVCVCVCVCVCVL